jgi:hypothetical protein
MSITSSPETAAVKSALSNTTMQRQTRAHDRVGFLEKTAIGAGGLPLFLGTAAIGSFAIP